jgi:hypothetical protein
MKTIILNFTFLLFGISMFAQNTWTVDNRPGTTAQFTSVQAAIDAAAEGDFIYVHPSPTSYGGVTIRKEIHLRGIGHGPELANGEFAQLNTISLSRNASNGTNASNSSMSGLYIQTISDGNEFPFSNILIQNNRINYFAVYQAYNFIIQGNCFTYNSGGENITFYTTSHANNLISHNIFIKSVNTQINGVVKGLISSDTFNNNIIVFNNTSNDKILFNACNNPIVNNNIIVLSAINTTATAIGNINNVNGNPINFQNCLTYAYGNQTLTALNGTNNLNNTNPQFDNIGIPENPDFNYTKSYKLKTGSPAIDAGSDGDDLGIYGQGFLFQMKGYPFDLPYPTTINVNNAVVEAGGNLEVVFKASANVEN